MAKTEYNDISQEEGVVQKADGGEMNDAGQKDGKKPSKWKYIYIIATVLVIVLIAFLDPGVKDVVNVLPTIDFTWVLLALGLLLLYWLSDAMILHHITTYVHGPVNFLKSVRTGILGLYYGALTPFATGGQPMQVMYMKRDGVPVGRGTCIVCIKFFLYELALCVFYVVAMVLRGAYFYANYNQVFWLTTLGFVINFVGLTFIFLVLVKTEWARRIVNWFSRVRGKIRILKHAEKTMHNVANTIDDYVEAAKYIGENKGKIILSFILSVFNFVCLFSIPYLICVAFGNGDAEYIELLTLMAFLYLAVAFMPTPGAAGASEGGFYLFFSRFFSNVFLPMVIWRFLTYYLVLFVGSIWVVIDELRTMGRGRKRKKASD